MNYLREKMSNRDGEIAIVRDLNIDGVRELTMDRMKELENTRNLDSLTYQQVEILKKEAVWRNLAEILLERAVDEWLATLSPLTAKNYAAGVRVLSRTKILDLQQTLQRFALENHEAALDRIKALRGMSEGTKQARAALYIALTRFLSRRTEGVIRKAVPSREGATRTFWRIRDKVLAEALTREEWQRLIQALEHLNRRDALIAKLCIQGARRIREVLELQMEQLNWEKRQVTFVQSKTKGLIKETVVTVPERVCEELRGYVGEREEGWVFTTASGGPVGYTQILESLKRAAQKAGIQKRVHPHVLRTSTITYLRGQGYQDFEIQRLTGHRSTQMLNAYDKTDQEENVSKRVELV